MKPNIIIYALAGTGKTFTLVEGIRHLRGEIAPDVAPSIQQRRIWEAFGIDLDSSAMCFAAFNVSIKEELERRIHPSLDCHIATMHGIGFRAIRNAIGLSGESCKFNKWKVYRLIERLHGMSTKAVNSTMPGYTTAVKHLVALSKFSCHCQPTNKDLAILAGIHGISLGQNEDRIFDDTRSIMQLCLADMHEVDFDDMPWIPVVKGLYIKKYDTLLVDEGQDLNHCQQELALRSGKRIILVGDRHQAIYGFAGADTKSMKTMQMRMSQWNTCDSFPLTVSRRCSQAVAREARYIVPDFEALPSNCEGSVMHRAIGTPLVNDMILCRTNAPLVSMTFKLIQRGLPCKIIGRDIRASALGLIATLSPTSVNDLMVKMYRQQDHDIQYLRNQKPTPVAAILAIEDKFACLLAICKQATSIEDVLATIDELFSSKSDEVDCIRLSSIHRAKGLEARNVYILHPELLPHPMANSDWQIEQEINLKYVAITRAIENLIWMRG